MASDRIILHIDMDAFFAAVEQRDNPALRGKPVIVGADPKGGKGRGVVSTCSYEARPFGVHSAQPISEAFRRCPHGIFLPVRMNAYVAASEVVFAVLEEFSPVIEPVSIDEAFLDVTGSAHLFGGKRPLAERLQRRIEEQTRLTASVGIAPCKMVAKIASDLRKPRGLVIVEPGEVEAFLRPLPIRRLWGIGEKSEEELLRLGVQTIGDLADLDRATLARLFGKHGGEMADLAHGRDDRPVEPAGAAKSVGNENTFERDTRDARLIASTLMELCESVAHRLRQAGLRGRTVTTKVRIEDFTTFTRAQTLPAPVDGAVEIYRVATANLGRVALAGHKVRLVGVSVSGFGDAPARQLSLFDAPTSQGRKEKSRLLGKAIDRIKNRFGHDALRQGTSLDRPEADRGNDE